MEFDDRGDSNIGESFASSLGRAVKVIRIERGLSRKDLAQRADISYSYVSEIENGRKPPSSPVLVRIAGALGLLPSDLLVQAESRITPAATVETLGLMPEGRRGRMLMNRGDWFHQAPAPSTGPRDDSGPSAQPESAAEADLERVQEEMQKLLSRMPVGDRERLLDLARRLAHQV